MKTESYENRSRASLLCRWDSALSHEGGEVGGGVFVDFVEQTAGDWCRVARAVFPLGNQFPGYADQLGKDAVTYTQFCSECLHVFGAELAWAGDLDFANGDAGEIAGG